MCFSKWFKRKMRRRISLYIDGNLVDLNDDSFILFNYAFEDLSNPTVVKNSYSQSIRIPATPNNNAIFGKLFRLDRVVGNGGTAIGRDFNPSKKTPFTIYNELGEVLESGYVKLEEITRSRNGIAEYSINLFGGLGTYLYNLSYDGEGKEKSLADLIYIEPGNPEGELTFPINAETITDAWDADFYGDVETAYQVINFMPAYEGIPDKDFSADKGVIVPTDHGLSASVTDDGKTYTTKSGLALCNLANKVDYWGAHDLRSYLMRPVLAWKAFLKAIADPANNGGYEVDYSGIDAKIPGDGELLFLTLPTIPSLGGLKQMSGDLTTTFFGTAVATKNLGSWQVSGSLPTSIGTKVTAHFDFKLGWNFPASASAYSEMIASYSYLFSGKWTTRTNAVFIQILAYASDNTLVGGSAVKLLKNDTRRTPEEVAELVGYVPPFPGAGYESNCTGWKNLARTTSPLVQFATPVLGMDCVAFDVDHYSINVTEYDIEEKEGMGFTYVGGGSASTIWGLPVSPNPVSPIFATTTQLLAVGSVLTYETNSSIRSGAMLTKRLLLGSTKKPADYLLSFCKMFGLVIKVNEADKKVTITKRDAVFEDTTIDLTKRIDVSQPITIKPYVYDAKWYDMSLESVGGAFADEYEKTYGRVYGSQRINTGYDFDAAIVNIMDSIVFRSAATILGYSRYYYDIFDADSHFLPSPFVDKGNTYTLWTAEGETIEVPISCPLDSATFTDWNQSGYEGYDEMLSRKLEFRDKSEKAVDGSGVLVMLTGWTAYDHCKVSDDTPAMMALNDNVPCWDLSEGDGVSVPVFATLIAPNDWDVQYSLDFDAPQELAIPGIVYNEQYYNGDGVTIYQRGWAKYLADRYNLNTKVMTCKVDLSGLQVNADLLGKFYWFENSLWVMNAIRNYSLTTYDLVECEFVQVQDKDNYLNGQDYS